MYKFTGFSTKANNAINLALLSAEQMGHTYVGSEHLLLGLLRESTGVAAMLMIVRAQAGLGLMNTLWSTGTIGIHHHICLFCF